MLLAAYSSSFDAGMVFDNAPIIGQDPRIRAATLQNAGQIALGPYWFNKDAAGLYRPFTTLTYLINYSVLGDELRPLGYHCVNLALHAINVALVYALGILMWEDPLLALALAALWGVHPLLTEAVTNIVGRADLLAALGVLAGLLSYTRIRVGGSRVAVWLACLSVSQALALFSKENGAVLPALILLYDLAWPNRSTWRTRALSFGVLAPPFAVYLTLRSGLHLHMLIPFPENPLASAGFWTARMTALKAIGKLLWIFLWPARLSADYSYNAVPLFGWRLNRWQDIQAILAAAVCCTAIFCAIRWRRRRNLLFFCLGFSIFTFLPVSNLVLPIGSILAERFFYLPSAGLVALLITALRNAVGPFARKPFLRPAAWATASIVCLALAGRTYARNFDWQNDLSLWSSAASVCPGSARTQYNLADALSQTPGRLPEAIDHFREAIRIWPGDANAHISFGNALARIPGQLPEAIAEFTAALQIDPNRAAAHYNLGNALSRMAGRMPDAIAEFQAAIRLQPDLADAHYNLARAYRVMPGRQPDSLREFEIVVQLRPELPEAHAALGDALAQTPGRLPDAIREFQIALHLDPLNAGVHNSLGIALAQVHGRLPDAIAEFEAAVRIAPGSAEGHHNLGLALLRVPGRRQEGLAELQQALRISPDPAAQEMLERLRTQTPPS